MGDKNRAREFARFIDRTFPDTRTVADVAGGHGELSYWLRELGYPSVIIDRRPTRLPRWIHRKLRKRAVRDGKVTTIERIDRSVEDVDLSKLDLVVALHPDQATEPALRAALRYQLDFAIVPCCVFALDGAHHTREGWVDYLASQASGIQRSRLPITGASTVLWRNQ